MAPRSLALATGLSLLCACGSVEEDPSQGGGGSGQAGRWPEPTGGASGEPAVGGGEAGAAASTSAVEGGSAGAVGPLAAGAGQAGEAADAGAAGQPTYCVPIPWSEGCADRECGEVSDGCGSSYRCGGCDALEEFDCVDGLCVEVWLTDPNECRHAVDAVYCEMDLPDLGYPETWLDCDEIPGDCIDAVEPLRSRGIDVVPGVWCCR